MSMTIVHKRHSWYSALGSPVMESGVWELRLTIKHSRDNAGACLYLGVAQVCPTGQPADAPAPFESGEGGDRRRESSPRSAACAVRAPRLL
jgi:hypothetical protein